MDKSPLMKLPAEIRNDIWELVLDNHTIGLFVIKGKVQGRQASVSDYRESLGLLGTCRAIRAETRDMFYAINTFELRSSNRDLVNPHHLSTPDGRILWPPTPMMPAPGVIDILKAFHQHFAQYSKPVVLHKVFISTISCCSEPGQKLGYYYCRCNCVRGGVVPALEALRQVKDQVDEIKLSVGTSTVRYILDVDNIREDETAAEYIDRVWR